MKLEAYYFYSAIAGEGDYLRFAPEVHLAEVADEGSVSQDPLSYAFGFGRRFASNYV